MVRREHRYTHVISTKVSLGMSTDKGRNPKSALHEANADCRMRNVQSKTTGMSVFSSDQALYWVSIVQNWLVLGVTHRLTDRLRDLERYCFSAPEK